ncbi:MAG: sporulation protein YqfD [Lachnospiraceae bacterium]
MKKLSSPLLTCSFTVCGLNLERFLALMQQEEIPLEDVRRTGRRTLRCQCRTADFAAVTQIAADKGWRIREVRPERASAVWSSWKARPGLWVGMALALLMLLLGSQRIWRVEIVGAGPIRPISPPIWRRKGFAPGCCGRVSTRLRGKKSSAGVTRKRRGFTSMPPG